MTKVSWVSCQRGPAGRAVPRVTMRPGGDRGVSILTPFPFHTVSFVDDVKIRRLFDNELSFSRKIIVCLPSALTTIFTITGCVISGHSLARMEEQKLRLRDECSPITWFNFKNHIWLRCLVGFNFRKVERIYYSSFTLDRARLNLPTRNWWRGSTTTFITLI